MVWYAVKNALKSIPYFTSCKSYEYSKQRRLDFKFISHPRLKIPINIPSINKIGKRFNKNLIDGVIPKFWLIPYICVIKNS